MTRSIWWGPAPPPSPEFGQAWASTQQGSQPVPLYVFNGEDWDLIASYDTVTPAWTIPTGGVAATIASATTTNIWAAANPVLLVTGTTTITGLGTPASSGLTKVLIFEGILTFTYGASAIIIPGGSNITTAVGDVATMMSVGSGSRLVSYQRGAGW